MLTITIELDLNLIEPLKSSLANPWLNIVWLTEDSQPSIIENTIIGYVLARISIEHSITKQDRY